MKKINFNIKTGTAVVVDVQIQIYKEKSSEYVIIVDESAESIEITAQNCLIQIKNADNETEKSANDLIWFNGLQERNHFIVISEVENDELPLIAIHPLKLIQRCRDIKALHAALNGDKNAAHNSNVALLSELTNLTDEDMIKDCKALLTSKRKLIALNNVLKNFVYIGLNNPIIWSQLNYSTICKTIKRSDFRNGEGHIITNRKIGAIPHNIVNIYDPDILDTYIGEGKVYFDILNKHGLAI